MDKQDTKHNGKKLHRGFFPLKSYKMYRKKIILAWQEQTFTKSTNIKFCLIMQIWKIPTCQMLRQILMTNIVERFATYLYIM